MTDLGLPWPLTLAGHGEGPWRSAAEQTLTLAGHGEGPWRSAAEQTLTLLFPAFVVSLRTMLFLTLVFRGFHGSLRPIGLAMKKRRVRCSVPYALDVMLLVLLASHGRLADLPWIQTLPVPRWCHYAFHPTDAWCSATSYHPRSAHPR